MRKILGLLATGCLALAANTASAIPIPLEVNVTVGGFGGADGEWHLTGPTNESRAWDGGIFTPLSWTVHIEPGEYLWWIDGDGAGFLTGVSWSLILAGTQIYSGHDGTFLGKFKVYDDHTFTATQVSEPGVLLLLGGGLLAFATVRRRKAVRA